MRVTDAIAGNYIEDLKTQTNATNYTYDAIGNLIKDEQEGISNIQWTVYRKIGSITKTDGSILNYTYNAASNRIEKKYTKRTEVHYTWYVRDAQGNVMAVYEKTNVTTVRLTETHLYGSSRLGIAKELTKKPVPVSGPANAKLYTFTRGDKFFETSLLKLKIALHLRSQCQALSLINSPSGSANTIKKIKMHLAN